MALDRGHARAHARACTQGGRWKCVGWDLNGRIMIGEMMVRWRRSLAGRKEGRQVGKVRSRTATQIKNNMTWAHENHASTLSHMHRQNIIVLLPLLLFTVCPALFSVCLWVLHPCQHSGYGLLSGVNHKAQEAYTQTDTHTGQHTQPDSKNWVHQVYPFNLLNLWKGKIFLLFFCLFFGFLFSLTLFSNPSVYFYCSSMGQRWDKNVGFIHSFSHRQMSPPWDANILWQVNQFPQFNKWDPLNKKKHRDADRDAWSDFECRRIAVGGRWPISAFYKLLIHWGFHTHRHTLERMVQNWGNIQRTAVLQARMPGWCQMSE